MIFKKHVLRDSWGSSDGGGGSTPPPTDTTSTTRTWTDQSGSVTVDPDTGKISWTAHNGEPAGSTESPAVPQNTTTGLSPATEGFLSKMFKPSSLDSVQKNLETLNTMNPNEGAFGLFQPGSLGYRWGLRDPGSAAARDFFAHETPTENVDRMGLVGQTLGTIGNAVAATAMPPPLSAMLGAVKGYQTYRDTGDVQRGLGTALTALPGYFGAAGNALQGNYGNALAGALTKSGIAGPEASLAGIGLDYGMGRDVTKPAAGLGGYFVGRSLGGPVGGVFGQNIGKSLANIYGKK